MSYCEEWRSSTIVSLDYTLLTCSKADFASNIYVKLKHWGHILWLLKLGGFGAPVMAGGGTGKLGGTSQLGNSDNPESKLLYLWVLSSEIGFQDESRLPVSGVQPRGPCRREPALTSSLPYFMKQPRDMTRDFAIEVDAGIQNKGLQYGQTILTSIELNTCIFRFERTYMQVIRLVVQRTWADIQLAFDKPRKSGSDALCLCGSSDQAA